MFPIHICEPVESRCIRDLTYIDCVGKDNLCEFCTGEEWDGRTSQGNYCQVYEVRICKDMHLIEVHS